MKEIPILFSTAMVQAILEGRKSQTRRPIKPQAMVDEKGRLIWKNAPAGKTKEIEKGLPMSYGLKDYCPYGKPGDILWVRETWSPDLAGDGENGYVEYIKYAADGTRLPVSWLKDYDGFKNRPGIHMNKEYARIWLQVTDIRVERLQDISEDDAKVEGVNTHITELGPSYFDYETGYNNGLFDARDSFRTLWRKINGAESWNTNPWVWAISFKVLSTTGKPK